MEAFINNEIITGLQKLMALRLVGSPAADTIKSTAAIWIEAIGGLDVNWNADQDRGRISKGFEKLIVTCDRWPAPKQLIHCLPPRPIQAALPQPKMSQKDKEHGKQQLENIKSELFNRLRTQDRHDGKPALEQALEMNRSKQ